jgi:hypothetical protein
MEAVSTSGTQVNFYQTAWHNIPEDSSYSLMSFQKTGWLKLIPGSFLMNKY